MAPVPPTPIRVIASDGPGEVCGAITSVTAGSEPDVWLAIGNVSRRVLDEGARLVLEGGGEVRVRS
jgi:hypothetical protein